MSTDRVDAYIDEAQPFARPILRHVRKLVHRALADVEEAIKWGMPYFVVNGKNAVGMAAFKQHAAVTLCSDISAGEGMGNFGKITSLDDLPADDELIAMIQDSAEAAQGRVETPPKPSSKLAIPMPDDFAASLAASPAAQSVFDGFTDAQRRDYLEWITSAKREETRVKRIATVTEWIGEGKKRNWKYEKC
ncbi:MAG: hypothetical protein HKO05_06380 [Erythrobacter sp.]|nr:hypothetical protein [Erythrobacter sp.]